MSNKVMGDEGATRISEGCSRAGRCNCLPAVYKGELSSDDCISEGSGRDAGSSGVGADEAHHVHSPAPNSLTWELRNTCTQKKRRGRCQRQITGITVHKYCIPPSFPVLLGSELSNGSKSRRESLL